MDDLISPETIEALTGYKLPHKQLAMLHSRGFYRAYRNPVTGAVVLERPHYEAVARGVLDDQHRPKVRPLLRSERARNST